MTILQMTHWIRSPATLWVPFLFTALFLSPTLTGCSTSRQPKEKNPPPKYSPELALHDSGIDIEYTLGRGHYHFSAAAKDQIITAQTSTDKQLQEKGTIAVDRYPEYFQKVSQFVKGAARPPSLQNQDLSKCRTPYRVTIRLNALEESIQGCRSTDLDGNLSKLIRDGEFLLYSEK